MTSPTVVVIGDSMLDEWTSCTTTRMSQEAPVPVLRPVGESVITLGGAALAALRASQLGVRTHLVTVSGAWDQSGQTLLTMLDAAGIRHSVIRDSERPTTLKTRFLVNDQVAMRLDRELDLPLFPPVRDAVVGALVAELSVAAEFGASADHIAVLVSDYGKGVVDERVVRSATTVTSRVVVDPKGLPPASLIGTFITPNVDEAGALLGSRLSPRMSDRDAEDVALRLLSITAAAGVVLTLGSRGAVAAHLISDDGSSMESRVRWHPVPRTLPPASTGRATVGAGDALAAGVAVGLAHGTTFHEAVTLGVRTASRAVCGVPLLDT